jgi:hypothetical protein
MSHDIQIQNSPVIQGDTVAYLKDLRVTPRDRYRTKYP